MHREWVKIRRKVYGMPDIVLEDAEVTPSEQMKNIVTITGRQYVMVGERKKSEFPTKEVQRPLPWWDPRRLIGITTKTVEVPDTDGWELSWPSIGFKDCFYTKHEWQPRSYRVNSTWIEMSAEE